MCIWWLMDKFVIIVLSVVQCIKMLGFEKAKKNKNNISFLVGERVMTYVERTVQLNKQLTALLK